MHDQAHKSQNRTLLLGAKAYVSQGKLLAYSKVRVRVAVQQLASRAVALQQMALQDQVRQASAGRYYREFSPCSNGLVELYVANSKAQL